MKSFVVAVGILIVALVALVGAQSEDLNLRPIIGVLTQPNDPSFNGSFGTQYLPASYVKFIEAGGARAVPVFYNSTTSEFEEIFSSINGLLIPGGASDMYLTPFFFAGQWFVNASIQASKNGDYFPIVGHCQGFEMLMYILSTNMTILTEFNAENITLPLNFTSAVNTSRWLGDAPSQILDILATQPVTMNNHMYGISPANFAANSNLVNFFSVLSTNVDRDGNTFVSTVEGINFPIYGIQWHAEKPLFEWNPDEVINHSPDAIISMQYFANFLANEARKSQHTFASVDAENAALIYNYNPVFTAPIVPDFEQCYFW